MGNDLYFGRINSIPIGLLPINQGNKLKLPPQKAKSENINPCKERIAEELEGFVEIILIFCNGVLLDSEKFCSIPLCKLEVK